MHSHTHRPVPVSKVMSSPVHTAAPDRALREIWRVLVDLRCHHMPIVENGRPIGILSTRDLVRVAHKHGARRLSAGLYGGEITVYSASGYGTWSNPDIAGNIERHWDLRRSDFLRRAHRGATRLYADALRAELDRSAARQPSPAPSTSSG